MNIYQKNQHINHTYKCILIGASGSGKSSLVLRFQKGIFNEYSESTIGAAFCTKTVNHKGEKIKLEIWDTAGQERYDSLMQLYYRYSIIAYVTFDITNRDSFNKAKKWVKEIRKNTNTIRSIVLIGNKIDLYNHRAISKVEAYNYCTYNNLMYIETSAKTNDNVTQSFMCGCEDAHSKIEQYKNIEEQKTDNVLLTYSSDENKGEWNCFGLFKR
jgi:Ras-related protein Rab-5C